MDDFIGFHYAPDVFSSDDFEIILIASHSIGHFSLGFTLGHSASSRCHHQQAKFHVKYTFEDDII